ncbi:hypothetical protein CPAR01_06872 [Colletotrichum paranaense]|uniref:Uncharacterized protein n=1 Tax=Colletotrichum paranaense TaxID=1914294 RepID=A0ABQ9SMY8_9PEZI|nr:uncharacterized protein CPAR01_06872 [Colletotrichum paranaense]KAK1540883.1 hypothetical protein CPAR01_06872 [Colletotrichum paranaense]
MNSQIARTLSLDSLVFASENDGLGSQQPRYFEYMRDVSGQPEVQSSGSARRWHRERSAINHVIPSQDVG